MTAHVYVTRAWSCTVRLAVTEPRAMPEAAADLDALLDRVDRLASRFRADSSLSIANARAGRPAAIPRLLADLVQAALDAAAYTGGAVDPTVGRAMRRIGYDRDIAAIRANGPAIAPSMGGARWTDVRLHRDSGLLTVPAGTELDLGATAKAYTADLAARTLYNRYGVGVLVELGGDLAVAGVSPTGWPVHVAEREGGPGPVVVLTHGGLTTSTMTVRRWRRGGRIAHHIVDARPPAGRWTGRGEPHRCTPSPRWRPTRPARRHWCGASRPSPGWPTTDWPPGSSASTASWKPRRAGR